MELYDQIVLVCVECTLLCGMCWTYLVCQMYVRYVRCAEHALIRVVRCLLHSHCLTKSWNVSLVGGDMLDKLHCVLELDLCLV